MALPSASNPGAMKSVEDYLELPYHVSVLRGDGPGSDWDARVEELPGCSATGRTPEEAVARVRGLMSSWLTEALEEQREIPVPRAEELPSGKLLVRMPRTLHADLARAADTEGVSLNQLIVGALTSAVAWRRAGGPAAPAAPSRSRTLTIVLAVNLAILALAAVVAVAALVAALG
jgi:antitoxin HicB